MRSVGRHCCICRGVVPPGESAEMIGTSSYSGVRSSAFGVRRVSFPCRGDRVGGALVVAVRPVASRTGHDCSARGVTCPTSPRVPNSPSSRNPKASSTRGARATTPTARPCCPSRRDGNRCASLAAASGSNDADEATNEAARRKLADCDTRLGRYRADLDGGADPAVAAAWIAEVQGDRLAAERALASSRAARLTPGDVRTVIESLGDVAEVLNGADPARKACTPTSGFASSTGRPNGSSL